MSSPSFEALLYNARSVPKGTNIELELKKHLRVIPRREEKLKLLRLYANSTAAFNSKGYFLTIGVLRQLECPEALETIAAIIADTPPEKKSERFRAMDELACGSNNGTPEQRIALLKWVALHAAYLETRASALIELFGYAQEYYELVDTTIDDIVRCYPPLQQLLKLGNRSASRMYEQLALSAEKLFCVCETVEQQALVLAGASSRMNARAARHAGNTWLGSKLDDSSALDTSYPSVASMAFQVLNARVAWMSGKDLLQVLAPQWPMLLQESSFA